MAMERLERAVMQWVMSREKYTKKVMYFTISQKKIRRHKMCWFAPGSA